MGSSTNWSIESEVGRSILYGSLSGLATSLLLQPLDRVKTLVQQTDNRRTPTSDIVRSTVRKEGVLSLWKGLSPTILRIVPGIALYLGFVTTAKQFVPESTMYQNFLIGFASRTSVALILQPTTVLKARLESSVYSRRNLADELRNILRTEGPAGLWRATVPTIVRDAPFSGLYLAFYRYQLSLIGVEGSHTAPVLRMACGMISGLAACLFTHPFDVIKTRIQ
ncbi:Solute carrier family 25 member 38 [Aphelenchoides avenae]|nr:Solute carrier family 25 member 38 [Aphelenchus avenae]